MKKQWKLLVGALLLTTVMTGCSGKSEDESSKKQLVVSTWGLSQEVWEK